MEQQGSILQRARQEPRQQPAEDDQAAGDFKRPNLEQFIPDEVKDAVARVTAAGMKLMYAPQMRDEVQKAIQSDAPIGQKLAENVTGLLLTLDQQSRGGIPVKALFPAAMELLGEAAEVLSAAGQTVTQADYNDAAQRMFVLIGQKLGATEEQLVGAAQQALTGRGQAAENEPGEGAQHEAPESPAEEGIETANPGAEPDEEQ